MNGQIVTAPARTAITADGAGVLLAAYLTVLPFPFVKVMHLVTGAPVLRVEVTDDGEWPADRNHADALSVPEGTTVRWRTGYLVTETGVAVADTTFTWLLERIPPEALDALEQGRRPAGHILGPLGATRERRAALAASGGGVASRATLMLRGLPVALATEQVTRGTLERMAGSWDRCLPGAG